MWKFIPVGSRQQNHQHERCRAGLTRDAQPSAPGALEHTSEALGPISRVTRGFSTVVSSTVVKSQGCVLMNASC